MPRINPKPKILVTELLMITTVFCVLIYAWLYAQQDNVEVKGKVEAQSLTIKGGTVLPPTPVKGEVFYNSSDDKFYAFNSTAWQAIGAGGAGAGADKTVASKIVAACNSLNSTRDGTNPCYCDSSTCNNPKADYTCDGLNDRNQIQTAIAALNTTPGVVYLLEGTYNMIGPISLDSTTPPDESGIAIIGTGRGTVLKLPLASANSKVIDAQHVSRILISQLMIDGNNKTGSGNYGIYFYNVTNSKIDKVWVENINGAGIYLYCYNNNNTLSNNDIQSSGDGIYFYYGNNNNIISNNNIQSNSRNGTFLYWKNNNNIISNNNVRSNGLVGINVAGWGYSSNNIISGNKVQFNLGEAAIQLFSSANNNTISGNIVQSNSGIGIRVYTSNNNIISGNNLRSNDWAGVVIEGNPSNNNIISGNIIYDNGGTGWSGGIVLGNDANNNTISSNLLYDSAGTGPPIRVDYYACDNTYIIGNLIAGWPAGYADYIDSGTNTTYTDGTKITLARASAAQDPGGTGTITPGPYTYIPLNPSYYYSLSTTTPIAAGKSAGDLLILENINATNSIVIISGGNTKLRGGNKVLSYQEMLTLIWDGFNATCCWVQTGGKD